MVTSTTNPRRGTPTYLESENRAGPFDCEFRTVDIRGSADVDVVHLDNIDNIVVTARSAVTKS